MKQLHIYLGGIAFMLGAAFSSTSLHAQGGFVDGKNSIEDAQLVLEKETQNSLPKASRIYFTMKPLSKQAENELNTDQAYHFPLIDYPLPTLTPKTELVETDKTSPQKYLENYVKVGFGNYTTPFAAMHLAGNKNPKLGWGVNASYLSSFVGPTNDKHSSTSLANIEGYGKYFLNSGRLDVDLGYNQYGMNYYGHGANYDIVKNSTGIDKQSYQLIKGNINFTRTIPRSPISYKAKVRLHNLQDAFKASESNFEVGGIGTIKLNEQSKLDLGLDVIITSKSDSIHLNKNMMRFMPAYIWEKGMIKVKAGANIAYNAREHDYSIAHEEQKSAFYIYPNLRLDYRVFEDELSLFAEVKGNLEQVSLRSLSQRNPFLNHQLTLAHQNNIATATFGAEGSVNKTFGARGALSYGIYKNMGFFLNNGMDSSRFDMFYDEENTGLFTVNGEIYAEIKQYISALSMNIYSYQLSKNLTEAWHKPTFTLSWNNTYQLDNKWRLGANFYYMGGIMALSPSNIKKELDPIIDLSLKADYNFFYNFSAFLELNNVLAQEYQRYLYYHSKTFHVLAGVSYKF